MITCKVGKLADYYKQLDQIMKDHFDEVGYRNGEIELNVNWNAYLQMEVAGFLTCCIAHADNGEIIGYSIDLVHPALHHQDYVYANNDGWWVKPSHRKSHVPKQFLKFVQDYLRSLGAHSHFITMMESHRYERLAADTGYSPIEQSWVTTL